MNLCNRFLGALDDDGNDSDLEGDMGDVVDVFGGNEGVISHSHSEPASEVLTSNADVAGAGGVPGDEIEHDNGEEEAARAKLYPIPGEPTQRER